MHKSQTRTIVLPCWTFVVLITALVSLLPALLYCISEIVVLKSRFEQQQQTIDYLEDVTAQIRSRTVGDEISSSKTKEAYQRFLKWKVWLFYLLLIDNCYFERPKGLANRRFCITRTKLAKLDRARCNS